MGCEPMAPGWGRNATKARAMPKQMQEKPSKIACISFYFLGRIGAFQWVTAEKIKKFCWLSTRVLGCG
jgi:hypothetical protein